MTLMCSFICCLSRPPRPSPRSPISRPKARMAILTRSVNRMLLTSKTQATKLRKLNSRRSSRTSLACAWRLRPVRSFAGHSTARKGVSSPRRGSLAAVVFMLVCAVVRITPCKNAKSDNCCHLGRILQANLFWVRLSNPPVPSV